MNKSLAPDLIYFCSSNMSICSCGSLWLVSFHAPFADDEVKTWACFEMAGTWTAATTTASHTGLLKKVAK